jgi:hypothetical protein
MTCRVRVTPAVQDVAFRVRAGYGANQSARVALLATRDCASQLVLCCVSKCLRGKGCVIKRGT